LLQNQKLNKTK